MRVGSANDFTKQRERGVGEFVFLEDGVERNIFAMMPEFAAVNVEGRCAKFLRFWLNLICGHKNKFSLRVNELLDEPRAGDAVNFYFFTRDPFHGCIRFKWEILLPASSCRRKCSCGSHSWTARRQ